MLPTGSSRRSSSRVEKAEDAVFSELAIRMIREPSSILQSFSDAVLILTGAESAGVSVLELDDERPEFRWLATSGRFGPCLGATLPRDRSPCGVVLQENSTLLIVDPALTFPEVGKLGMPVSEVLLSPFQREGSPVGTVWAVSHTPTKHFDQGDARLLDVVARFASAASEVLSQLQEAEKANRQLLLEGEQRRRGQSAMLAILAHELRSPLGTLSNAFAIVKQDPTGDGADRASSIAERQLRHMSRLLDALLDDVRLEHASVRVASTIPMRQIVRDAAEMSAGDVSLRGHDLRLDLPDAELYVRGDPTQLVEIVVNLLTNAAKYMNAGGRIALSLKSDKRDVVLQVQDNGRGIDPSMLGRVFEIFIRADRTDDDKGVGVGLAVVARLAGQHGGSVSATSPGIGKGSTFTVRLPLMAPFR